MIFAQQYELSTGKVCPTRRFQTPTPENKGRNAGHALEKRRFVPRTGKDGLARLYPFEGKRAVFAGVLLTGLPHIFS